MIVRPFRLLDYATAKLVNGIGLEHWGLIKGLIPVLQYMASTGTFWTLCDGDEIVLIAGWYEAWGGVCEVVLFPTERFVRSPVGALMIIIKKLRELKTRYRRVQLNCRREPLFTEFARRLGFQTEGILRRFGHDGHDHVMMSIVEGI